MPKRYDSCGLLDQAAAAASSAAQGGALRAALSLGDSGSYRCRTAAFSKGSQGLAALGDGMAAARRIICVGHAALDRIYRIEAFPPEPTKVRALEHIEAGGGMAANAAVAIARLGGKAELWSRTGDDAAGVSVRAGLQAEGVDVRYLQAFEGARTSTSAIIVDRRASV